MHIAKVFFDGLVGYPKQLNFYRREKNNMKQETVMFNDELKANGVNYVVSFDPARWMTEDPNVRELTLDQVTLLGSHDAGMSRVQWSTTHGTEGRTVTQTCDILQQLNFGVRYFDIRPTYFSKKPEHGGDGDFYCGHFSDLNIKIFGIKILGWEGAIGQSLSSIIEQINNFCIGKKELIILNIGHVLHIDNEGEQFRDFDSEDWMRLSTELSKIKCLCQNNSELLCPDINSRKTIGELTSEHSVVVVVDQKEQLIGNFCKPTELPVDDYFTNIDEVDQMKKDQFDKLKKYGNNQDRLFLLSWTLTQSDWDAIKDSPTVLELAEEANERMLEIFDEVIATSLYPNIVHLDKIDSIEGFYLCQQLNELRVTTNRCRINTDCSLDKVLCGAYGFFDHIITDQEIESFGVQGTVLKGVIRSLCGKEPNDVYLHSPTPWGDLYKTYEWDQIQTFSMFRTQPIVEAVNTDHVLKDQKTIVNDEKEKKSFEVVFSSEYDDYIESLKWSGNFPCPGFAEKKNYISYKTTFPSVDPQGETLTLNSRMPVGVNESFHLEGTTETRKTIELEPGQSARAEYYVDVYTAKIKVPFKIYVQGAVAMNYNPTYQGHHFYGIPIETLMNGAGIPNDYSYEQEIAVCFCANPRIEIVL